MSNMYTVPISLQTNPNVTKMFSNDTLLTPELFHDEMEVVKKNFDMCFLIIMGNFVFLLKAAFAFFEMSFVRTKNVVSVLFRNYLDAAISVFAFGLTGYGLSFGKSNGFCGTQYFALVDLPDDRLAHCFFMFTFAAIAATIPSGVVHERCCLTAYICYTALISGFIYPVATHWAVDKGGWLNQLGFDDFAFGAVVHGLGGAASLAAAYMAGPRIDRYDNEGKIKHIPIHSSPAIAMGAYIFILGMVAFNSGSQGSISGADDGSAIVKVALNMMVCVTGSTITALLYHRFYTDPHVRSWDLENGLNGSIVGMVVICAGCNQYRWWGAFIVGISGYFIFLSVRKVIRKLKIDDVLDGVALHVGGGYWGTLGVSIFKENGLFLNPCRATAYALLINTLGGLAIMAWSFSITLVFYVVLRYFGFHRVSNEDEMIGLDAAVHREISYNSEDTLIVSADSATVIHPNINHPLAPYRRKRKIAPQKINDEPNFSISHFW